jgi:hypothetical protein
MVKALRRWLQANELVSIVTGVVGALLVLSLLLVFGGYLIGTLTGRSSASSCRCRRICTARPEFAYRTPEVK